MSNQPDPPECPNCEKNQTGLFSRRSRVEKYEYRCEMCNTHYNDDE